jgi:hypothetical protein
MTTEA